jgi:glycosyltransferase involved in cell wall biosynthesis
MLVSVIIPFYDAGRYAKKIVESLKCQKYNDIEVVIVDDGSGSGVNEMEDAIRTCNLQIPVIWRRTSGRTGPGNARNVGIDSSRGDIIAFLDCDDYWGAGYIESMVDIVVKRGSGLAACCSSYFVQSEHGENIKNLVVLPNIFSESQLLQTNPFNPSAVMVHRSSLGSLRFNNCGHEDLDLWIRLARQNGPFHCLSKRLVFVARSDGSRSSNKIRAVVWQWLVINKLHSGSIIVKLGVFVVYIINAVLKRVLLEYTPITILFNNQ